MIINFSCRLSYPTRFGTSDATLDVGSTDHSCYNYSKLGFYRKCICQVPSKKG